MIQYKPVLEDKLIKEINEALVRGNYDLIEFIQDRHYSGSTTMNVEGVIRTQSYGGVKFTFEGTKLSCGR